MPTKMSEVVVVVEEEQEVMGLSNSNSSSGSSNGSSVETTEAAVAAGEAAVLAVCPTAPDGMQQHWPSSNGATIKYRVCYLRRPIVAATTTTAAAAAGTMTMSAAATNGSTPTTPLPSLPSGNSYGFDLHAERDRMGHFIGHVTVGSVAEAAGLRENDRIIEVNGYNVEMETHKQVVNRIRLNSHEVKLLVVDGDNANVMRPLPLQPIISDSNNNNIPLPTNANKYDVGSSVDGILDPNNRAKAAFLAAAATNNATATTIANNNNNVIVRMKTDNLYPALNLNYTASEFRAKLAARKKYDPKKEPINFRRKYEIIQDL